ncbi:MAG: redoxin [Candidatus Marinimicrobia bacterium]|nr:redoxin [Candidatus Neomarinimicrobiota bacterium]
MNILIKNIKKIFPLDGVLIFLIALSLISCENSPAQKDLSSNEPKNKKIEKNLKKDSKGSSISAPDFTLADLNGDWISLNQLKGKVVLLNFWGTWCGPCRKEIPDFIKLSNKYKKEGLEIVGITLTSGPPEKISDFADNWGINYTLLTDIEGNETQMVTALYGRSTGKQITGIPTTFLIDREGFIRKRYVGPRSEAIFYNDIKPYL